MSIKSTLKREGINIIGQLNTMEINKIASNISEKLSKAFPEHQLNQSDLFISIARLNMYLADMSSDMAMAKYFYKNNSIYFSKDMDLNTINTLALHESIHYIQTVKNNHGKLLRLGLFDPRFNEGTGLNEAAVQTMASIATNCEPDSVKYYNMDLNTISPDYYPIQTALINEMMYFTGSYALFHSTLYSNDVFKNTFIAKSNEKAYDSISYNFDLILEYESRLSNEIYKLSVSSENISNTNKIKRLNERIAAIKNIIFEKTLETQNIIMYNCFNKELDSIKTLEDVKEFQENIYNFKDHLITAQNYNYYNDFYIDMMNKLEEKKEFILKYGNILTLDSLTNELSCIEENSYGFQFFRTLFRKIKLLFEEKIREKNY